MIQKLHNANNLDSSFRILYDGMIFQRQAAGGINRYFEKLIGNLPDEVKPLMTLSCRRNTNFPKNVNLQLHLRRFRLPRPFRKLSRAIQSVRFENIQRKIQPDLIHSTYYDTLGGCERSQDGPPLVVTVHDMTHEKFPRLLDRRGKHAFMKRRAIDRADAIICVSNRTREDLLERFPECEDRTTVVYHATELGSVTPDDWAPESNRPFFLYVGSRATYKNFDRLLKALQTVVAKQPDVQLRSVGAPFSKQERDRIAGLGLSDHVLAEGFVNDSRLAKLYRMSVGLVYPSLYEGFGLPLLEAMSCDTPVLAADCSCIPEVVQDAALLFNPYSESDLVEGLSCLLNDTQLRESLVRKGKKRCQEFSWSRTAQQTVNVYQALLAHESIRGRQSFDGSENATTTNRKPQVAIGLPVQAMRAIKPFG